MGRAFSEADASMLLNEAKALGVNMIRLAHYPQNEYIVRMAEKMGIILWQEIPIWQGIDFEDRGTLDKARTMLREMINRDKNRCAVCFWGVANETKPSDARNAFLLSLLKMGVRWIAVGFMWRHLTLFISIRIPVISRWMTLLQQI